jgi:CPA2 family monovalent cation:H+ antiporter-2
MAGITLIQDFAILLLAAGLAGSLCKRLGLSVIVGYLVAGLVIGPHTPPFSLIVDEARILALSQVGLVFLMFSIGLGLSLTKFARMGAATVIATGIGAFLILNLTQLLGFAVGWRPLPALFVAAMLMVSSSAVIAKIVNELKLSHERSSQLALAVTLLEDVVAVAMLTLLASQAHPGAGGGGLGRLLGGLSAFVVLLISAGLLLVPRLMRRLESRADPELQTIVVAGVLFLLALIAAKAGYSIALGAFLLGAIVAELPQKTGVERSFGGLRDLFSSVFFVSIGMMIDPHLLVTAWPAVLLLSAFALIARPLACGVALILVGTDPREARRASLLLTPLGEFSFIIAQLGVSTAVLPRTFYPIAVGASILTVLATPVMNRHRDAILRAVARLEPRWLPRTLEAYHGWLLQVRERPVRRPIWKLLRGRLIQITIEMLLVSGLLIYSRQLLEALAASSIGTRFARTTFEYVYWSAVTVVALVPLVAIWRNGAAVALIVAEGLEGGPLPRLLVERVVRALLALGLGYWIYVVMPHGSFTRWGWLVIAAGAAAIVTVFSRRLIYWHSEFQSTVRAVLADRPPDRGEARAQARAALGESLGAWHLALADSTVPDDAAYAGRTLAQLAIPARFGCTVVELDRNGHPLTGLGPETAVFAGDELLLLGEPAQIAVAREFLNQEVVPAANPEAPETAILDHCRVTGPRSGHTLAELQVAGRTGVRIVGIQRGDQRIINPAGSQRLEEGDALLLLGTLANLRRFRQWLAGPPA